MLSAGPRCSRSWLALKRLANENCAVLPDLVAERDAEMKSLRNSLAVLQPVSAAHARQQLRAAVPVRALVQFAGLHPSQHPPFPNFGVQAPGQGRGT